MAVLLNNRYRILQILGRGGCSETFLAEDTHMPSRRKCVIKQLKPVANSLSGYHIVKERFEREAAILEMIGRECEQIPKLHAYFTENQEFYLVQDWIEGQTLEQKVAEGGIFSEHAVRNLLVTILLVLDYIHRRGIIHRDIKPANIMLRNQDGKPFLIDFGAVKELVTSPVDSRGMMTGTIVIGSPGYMPPEQAMGQPLFSSDLYSLGWTAIFLLTGKDPRELDSSSTQNSWRAYAPQVSPRLAAILDKAIKPAAAERYYSAREMLQALQISETIPYGPVTAAPTLFEAPKEYQSRSFPLIPVVLGVIGILLLVLSMAGVGLYKYSASKAEAARKRAEQEAQQEAQRKLEEERALREAAEQKRIEAEKRAKNAEEAAAIEKAKREGKFYQVVRIINRTRNPIKYQVLDDDGTWYEANLKSGETGWHWRKDKIVVKFDYTLSDGDKYMERRYTLDATTVIGHSPTESEKNSAQRYYFDLNASGDLDLYKQN